MSAASVTSISITPLRAFKGLLSTSIVTRSSLMRSSGLTDSIRAFDQAMAMLDVVFELVPEVFYEAAHRHRSRIPQRADRAPLDLARDTVQFLEIFGGALTLGDPCQHPVQPARPFPARRTLTARFRVVKTGDPPQYLDHAGGLVHHDHRPRAQHRSRFSDGVIVHGEPHHDLAGQHRHRRATRDHGLELTPLPHTPGEIK